MSIVIEGPLSPIAYDTRPEAMLGAGAVKVLVTFDPALLERVDAYAKGKNLKRSQLIALALKKQIAR